MILSVIQNIISNAIKNSQKNGKVIVFAKKEAETIIVEIRDHGIGMSKQMQDNIFIPQLNSLSKARQDNKGAGIGLLLTKSFIEKNNGQIWVKSTEGEGTSFYFSLPLNKPLEETSSEQKIDFNKSH